MQVTLSRVVEAARQRKAAVTAEAGGYIVLLAVQRLAAQPRQIDSELIQLNAAGEILIESSDPAPLGETEAALRRLLHMLVSLSHTSPPALRAAAERPATGSLAALESELTAALIPINHAASGRALARLFRETEKALRGSPSSAAGPNSGSATPSVPESAELSTPGPAPVSGHPPVSAAAVPPADGALQEAGALDIDVEVEAGDDEEPQAAAVSSRDEVAEASAALAAPAAAPTDAPQLVVEELDELDVHELEAEESLGGVALPGSITAAAAEEPRQAAAVDEPFAEASEVADELDVLLAELPPPLPPQSSAEPHLDLSPVSDEVSNVDAAVAATAAEPQAGAVQTEPPPHRSDLCELLAGFLAHTRCEEEMTATLRRMVGLEPWRPSGANLGPKMGPPEVPGRTG